MAQVKVFLPDLARTSLHALHGCEMLSHGVTSPGPSLCRHRAQDEAARLKAEILQRGDELAKLEQLAGTVSSSRQASKLGIQVVSSDGPSPNGITSPSTSRIIEQLQKEIDRLKLACEAAVQSFVSEKLARETLKLKYDDLESTMASLRTQANNHAYQLRRSDQAMALAKTTKDEMKALLASAQECSHTLRQTVQSRDAEIFSLREALCKETSRKEQVEQQHMLLEQSYRTLKLTTDTQMATLRGDLDAAKSRCLSEMHQTRSAKEDIILLNEQQRQQYVHWTVDRIELTGAYRKQQDSLAQDMRNLVASVKQNLLLHETQQDRVLELQEQMNTLAGIIGQQSEVEGN